MTWYSLHSSTSYREPNAQRDVSRRYGIVKSAQMARTRQLVAENSGIDTKQSAEMPSSKSGNMVSSHSHETPDSKSGMNMTKVEEIVQSTTLSSASGTVGLLEPGGSEGMR